MKLTVVLKAMNETLCKCVLCSVDGGIRLVLSSCYLALTY